MQTNSPIFVATPLLAISAFYQWSSYGTFKPATNPKDRICEFIFSHLLNGINPILKSLFKLLSK